MCHIWHKKYSEGYVFVYVLLISFSFFFISESSVNARRLRFVCLMCNECFASTKDLAEHEKDEHCGLEATDEESDIDNIQSTSQSPAKDLKHDDYNQSSFDLGSIPEISENALKNEKLMKKYSDLALQETTMIEEKRKRKWKAKKHLVETEYYCFECEFAFQSKTKLSQHLREVHLEGSAFICQNSEMVENNIQSTSQESNEDLKANDNVPSSFELNSEDALKNEKLNNKELHSVPKEKQKRKWKSKKEIDKPEYYCFECEFEFQSQKKLSQHLQEVHLEGPDYICQHCSRTFTSEKVFTNHIGKCVSFRCQFCNKTFLNKSNLIRHELCNHLNQGTFSCPNKECPKTFMCESELARHVRRCLKDQPEEVQKPFGCEKCDKRFVTEKAQQVHISMAHVSENTS